MRSNSSHSGRNLIGLILFLICYVLPLTLFASDPYTDALNAEANNITVDPDSKGKDNSNVRGNAPSPGGWSNKTQSIGEGLPPELSKEEFEGALRGNFYGSYAFYLRLDEQKQEEVYRFYQNNPSIGPVRERIIQLKKNL